MTAKPTTGTDNLKGCTMNQIVTFTIFVLILVLSSCAERRESTNIPAEQFRIPTEVIDSHLPLEVQITQFRCELKMAHGKDIYLVEPLHIGLEGWHFKKIQYSEGLNNVMILLGYSPKNDIKSCFLIWQNGDSGPKDVTDMQFFDTDIGRDTNFIETNIDDDIVKEMYPDIKCTITRKIYKEIRIDFNKDLQNLDFFKNIKLVD